MTFEQRVLGADEGQRGHRARTVFTRTAGRRVAGLRRDGAHPAILRAGEREREHRAEAETGGEDAVLVDAQLRLESIEHGVQEREVFAALVPPAEPVATEVLP